MKKLLAISLTALVIGSAALPSTADAASIVVSIGDRPYYRGHHYWRHHHRYVWVPGHWAWRHHHRIWIHGDYARLRG